MRKLSTDELRKEFLDFFAAHDHTIVPSDSLVPADDATVLFTSAGMNQFKRQFMGRDITFRRATTCQKCLRTDDLDKVGKTEFHHTFFEMLGNFSFGDYFKEEAIKLAWSFLTEILGIAEEKLWVSVYKDDKEAFDIWHKNIGLAKKKIIPLSEKDNFWPSEAPTKGPNGPCGPCSEIFFDRGKNKGCKKKDCQPGCNCARFVEIWNLVFTQFNRVGENKLEPLPFKNIDTGLGLERMSSVLQGAGSNFEIDIFRSIIDSLMAERKIKHVSSRIIADHIRAVVFAVSEGVNPSNEERGYVVRKLIRRCVLHYRDVKLSEPLLYKLVYSVAEVMKNVYPEISTRRDNISQIIKREEESFLKMLQMQLPLVKEKLKIIAKMSKKEKQKEEAAKAAFEFYDTFGVPYEILEEEALKYNIKIEKNIFDNLLILQKERSQSGSSMKGDIFQTGIDLDAQKTEFVGYESLEIESILLKIIKEGKPVTEIKEGEADFVLDKTVFYAESGGQAADIGLIKKQDGALAEVLDVKNINNVISHHVKVTHSFFKLDDKVKSVVNAESRFYTACNHSATHLLQSALRKVLGEHVQQAGSLVDSQHLRFDFTHFSKVNAAQLLEVEELVNNYISQNDILSVKVTELAQARKEGALAFFNEKYQPQVRVVSIGDYSKELCAGTHLKSTGQIGIFKIISESAISQGIRRIEAVTSKKAYQVFKKQEDVLGQIVEILRVPNEKVVEKIQSLTQECALLQKNYANLKLEEFKKALPILVEKESKQIGASKILIQKFKDINQNVMRTMLDLALQELKSGLACFGSIYENKVFLVLGITKDLVQKGLDASLLIKDIAQFVGGSGGGRVDFAQAGGIDPLGLDKALSNINQLVEKKIN